MVWQAFDNYVLCDYDYYRSDAAASGPHNPDNAVGAACIHAFFTFEIRNAVLPYVEKFNKKMILH